MLNFYSVVDLFGQSLAVVIGFAVAVGALTAAVVVSPRHLSKEVNVNPVARTWVAGSLYLVTNEKIYW